MIYSWLSSLLITPDNAERKWMMCEELLFQNIYHQTLFTQFSSNFHVLLPSKDASQVCLCVSVFKDYPFLSFMMCFRLYVSCV